MFTKEYFKEYARTNVVPVAFAVFGFLPWATGVFVLLHVAVYGSMPKWK